MGTVPFAFSVHHFINSVGADAGFASIIGLAILVLLYFAQARETATLREQAYEWAQRVQQLEGRIAQLTRQAPPPAPPPGMVGTGATQAGRTGAPVVPAPAGLGAPAGTGAPARAGTPGPATAAASGGIGGATQLVPGGAIPSPAASGLPGAPAGVGAPALTAATKLIPTGGPAVAEPAEENSGEPDLTTVGRPSSVAAATAAGGANGSSGATSPPPPFGVTAAPTQAPVAEPIAAPVPPRIQINPSGQTASGRRQTMPPRQPPRNQQRHDGSSPRRRLLAGVIVLVVIGAVVAALLLLTNGNGSNSTASRSTTAANNASSTQRPHKAKTTAVTPSNVTVAVLNGTATNQLAHKVAVKLGGFGYKQGNVAGAADQTHTATVVAYVPGHRRDALAVASSLKLGPASVQPIDQNTQATCAVPPATTCAANVVVTVGSDLANTQ